MEERRVSVDGGKEVKLRRRRESEGRRDGMNKQRRNPEAV